MTAFFVVIITLGAFMIWADHSHPSDSVPVELANIGGVGAAMVALGLFGLTCVLIF